MKKENEFTEEELEEIKESGNYKMKKENKSGITILNAEPVTDKMVKKMLKKEEFNLSEKILKNIIEKASTPEMNSAMWLDREKTLKAIDEKVKEFIKKLKEGLYLIWGKREGVDLDIMKLIDKLAGDKLI